MKGRVRCSSDGFWPEILAGEVVAWSTRNPVYDVWTARAMLAEAVALAGLCFWPPSYLNDLGRELGVSPWINAQRIDMARRLYEFEPARPLCAGCGQEIDPDCCGCGSPMDSHDMHEGHAPVPMGCDCFRSDR